MASGARQTPTTTTLVHFLALPRHALSCCVQRRKRSCTSIHVQRRVCDARRSRARYERGDRDRATARSTVTRAYIGPEALPAPPDHLALLSLCISRSRYGQTEPTLSHSIVGALGESPLQSSFLCLPDRPGPIFVDYLSSLGPDSRSRDSQKIVSARTGGIKFGEIP